MFYLGIVLLYEVYNLNTQSQPAHISLFFSVIDTIRIKLTFYIFVLQIV